MYTDAELAAALALRRHRRAAAHAANVDDGNAEDRRYCRARGSPVELDGESPLTVLDEAGFVRNPGHQLRVRDRGADRLGEVVTATSVLESISDENKTRMGRGHFVTWITTYRDEQGEIVGGERRVFKFRVDGALAELAHRAARDARHEVLLGRRAGAQAAHPALHRSR